MSGVLLGYCLAELARLLLVYSKELCSFNFESLERDQRGSYTDQDNHLAHIQVLGSRWLPQLRALIGRYSQIILINEYPDLEVVGRNEENPYQVELHAFRDLASPTQLAQEIKKLCDQIALEEEESLLEKVGQLDSFLADHQASCRAQWEKAAAEAYFNDSGEYPTGYHPHT